MSRSAGIDFVHQAPKLDPKLDHIMPQIASMGASVAVADFDRDGWQDFYTTDSGEGSRNRLYRNLGDGTFRDVAGSLGVADVNRPGTGVSMGSLWGDYDNDGYEDLFVYKWGRPELFHNDAGRAFTRVTDKAGLPPWVNAGCATWLDYDRDGRLDLFLAGYWDERLDLWHLKTTKMMPESFEYAQNGGRKYLFRNKGDGTFEDVTAAVEDRQPSMGPLRGRRRPARHRLSRPVRRQRLRRLGAVRQPGGQVVPRDRQADRHRLRPQERDERRVRRHLQPGPALDLRDEHLRGGRADSGQQPVGAQGGDLGRLAPVREPRRLDWASSWAAGASAPSSAT